MFDSLCIQRKTLANGIKFVQFPRSQKLTAQLSVFIHFGSKIGTEKNSGIAHYLEHMVGGGSKERIGAMHSIEQHGCSLDLSTDLEFTHGFVDVFPEKLDAVSKVVSKLFFEHDFEEKKFDLEKKVILDEIAEYLDDPWAVAEDMLRKNLYKNHPIRHPILGYPKTLCHFSLAEIIEAKQTYYVPQNTIVVLSGNYSDNNVESVIQNFGEIKKSKTSPKKYSYVKEAESNKTAIINTQGKSQAYLGFGYKTVFGNHPDNPVMELFSAIMGAGESSRLFREFREKRALAYSIHSSTCNGEDFGFFSIQCAVKSSRIKKATNLILKEITKLKTKKVSDEELSKSKNMFIGDFLREIDNSFALQTLLARLEILFADEYAIPKYVEKVKSVSVDDLIEVANKYLGDSNSSEELITSEQTDSS